MANYGGPDASIAKTLADTYYRGYAGLGESLGKGISSAGKSVAKGITDYNENKAAEELDLTDLGNKAGLSWEGKADGKRFTGLDLKKTGLGTLQGLTVMNSLVKVKEDADRVNNNLMNDTAYRGLTLPYQDSGGDWGWLGFDKKSQEFIASRRGYLLGRPLETVIEPVISTNRVDAKD